MIYIFHKFSFFREGCIEALLALVENVSVNKAVTTVSESGINHKSVVVKAQTAKLLDHVITAIGPERFYGSSKDTQVRSFCFFVILFVVIYLFISKIGLAIRPKEARQNLPRKLSQ